MRSIPFETRLEAAEALGRAGDPRLVEGVDNWVRVEGAEFAMGGTKRRVKVAPFYIGRYPVTVTEYERFVNSDAFAELRKPEGWNKQLRYPNRPVTGVSWFEASACCKWKGVRLPAAEEWECAARCGRDGVEYPWGSEEPDEFRANYFHEGSPQAATPVGMYPEGATPNGIQDLAGNVCEWTGSWYVDDRYRRLCGGAWSDDRPGDLRVSKWAGAEPAGRRSDWGFRCARELPS